MSRALVTLAEQGVEAGAAAKAKLAAAYQQFMATEDPRDKGEAGQELIRAIFGRTAIAEDPLTRYFGSFILCGAGEHPNTILKGGMKPFGTQL